MVSIQSPVFVEPACGEGDIVVTVSVRCICVHCGCMHLSGHH